jgi:hypothetical protein
MAANSLRQQYDIRGGEIRVQITTEVPLTPEEIEDYSTVATACEDYAKKWKPVRSDRLEAEARAELEGAGIDLESLGHQGEQGERA